VGNKFEGRREIAFLYFTKHFRVLFHFVARVEPRSRKLFHIIYYITLRIGNTNMNNGLRNRRSDRLPVLPVDMSSEDDYDKKYSTSKQRLGCVFKRNQTRILTCLLLLFCGERTLCFSANKSIQRSHKMLTKPRAIQLDGTGVLRLDLSLILVVGIPNIVNSLPRQRRSITFAAPTQYEVEVISNDDDESSGDDDDDVDCIPLVDWQEFVFPTCNKLHENEILPSGRYIDSGYNRDVWSFRDWDEEYMVLKTLAVKHPFTPFMIDLHRIDALISERSTASKYITNVYAYCKCF